MKLFRTVFALLLISLPAAAQFWGGSTTLYDKASWGLCTAADCQAGDDLTVPWISVHAKALKPAKCFIRAKTAPAGAALIVDVLKNGGTSIFGANKLQLADGASSGTTTSFATGASLAEGDTLTVSITQVGSTTAGKALSISCKFTM